jgi:methyl-accepting chemotaxis protein
MAVTLVLQLTGGATVREKDAVAETQVMIALDALDAKASVRGMQMAIRDVLLASDAAELQAASQYLKSRHDSALKFQGEMLRLSKSPENRTRIERLETLMETLVKGTEQVAAQRRQIIEAREKGGDAAEVTKFNAEIARIRKEVTIPAAKELENTANQIADFAKDSSHQARATAQAESLWVEHLATITSIAVAILLIGSCVLMIFVIARPMRTLAASMGKLAAGSGHGTRRRSWRRRKNSGRIQGKWSCQNPARTRAEGSRDPRRRTPQGRDDQAR